MTPDIEEKFRDVLCQAVSNAVFAKDRIFFEYLTSRGLVADYEEWVGALNLDEERMNRLVLGQ